MMIGQLRSKQKVFAYLRTSSAANTGEDKDSDTRQLEAIKRYAENNHCAVAATFYDAAVSGGDHIADRKGFTSMLEAIAGNGVRTIVVETANRFARDLMVQEVGYRQLAEQGITLIAADSPQSFVDDTPTATLIRQVLGAVSEFDKAMTVAKLKGARDRKRLATGKKVEGRKALHEINPEAVLLAKKLRRASPKTGERRSLRKIAAMLAGAGHLNERGAEFNHISIKRMVEGPTPALNLSHD
jgi:DNA invertase Pin-like site-specific DNA recombinase